MKHSLSTPKTFHFAFFLLGTDTTTIYSSMDQEAVPNRSIVGSFYSNLLKLDTNSLNTINIKEHPKWGRRLIDAERKRRKSSGNTAPTKAEKSRIISIGEGKAEDSSVKIKNRNPMPRN